MAIVAVLFKQILIMFIMMGIGFILFRSGKMTLEASESFGNILVYLVIPAVVIKSYMVEYDPEKMKGLLCAFVFAIVALLLSTFVSMIIFKKHPVELVGAAYCNSGFMGIPLVSMVLGDEAVFYVSAFVVTLNLLQYSYGAYAISQNKKAISVKRIVTNPVLIAFIIGMLLFILPLPKMPSVITTTIDYVSAINAPLAMLCVGVYLAQMKPRELFTDKIVYGACFVRLILIPLLTIAALSLIPIGTPMVKVAIMLVSSTPVGTLSAVYAQLFGGDYVQAVKSICLSTIFCIISMPLVIALASMLWGFTI